jgi:hypothetical protein
VEEKRERKEGGSGRVTVRKQTGTGMGGGDERKK